MCEHPLTAASRNVVLVIASPRAVVFDNDGLLLDTEEAWTRAEVALFAGLGREFTSEHKRDLIGSSRSVAAVKLEAILERPGEGERLMDELIELVMDEALAGVQPRPGALELLARLSDAGVPLAVATNSEPAFLQRTLASVGLWEGGPFRTFVCAEDVARPKPAPDIYLEACRRLGSDPAAAIAARGLAHGDDGRIGGRDVRDRRPLLPGQRAAGSRSARGEPRGSLRRAGPRPPWY